MFINIHLKLDSFFLKRKIIFIKFIVYLLIRKYNNSVITSLGVNLK